MSGASPKPLASQVIERGNCSIFIHLRYIREDDYSYYCSCAALHEYGRFIRIGEKHFAFVVVRPIDVLDLAKDKLLTPSQRTAGSVTHSGHDGEVERCGVTLHPTPQRAGASLRTAALDDGPFTAPPTPTKRVAECDA